MAPISWNFPSLEVHHGCGGGSGGGGSQKVCEETASTLNEKRPLDRWWWWDDSRRCVFQFDQVVTMPHQLGQVVRSPRG